MRSKAYGQDPPFLLKKEGPGVTGGTVGREGNGGLSGGRGGGHAHPGVWPKEGPGMKAKKAANSRMSKGVRRGGSSVLIVRGRKKRLAPRGGGNKGPRKREGTACETRI